MTRVVTLILSTVLCSACDDDSKEVRHDRETVLETVLDLEISEQAALSLARDGRRVVATLEVSRGFGVVPDGTVLSGIGRVDAYPEAHATIYTARFVTEALPGGPCGAARVSSALSLHRRRDTDVVAGGLTSYCGSDVFHGIPASEPLRLSGRVR